MHRKTARNSSLFLLELVAAIFFFCLASAVCVRFFVKSHTVSQDTHNLDMAVNEASSVAEMFRSEKNILTFLETTYPDGESSADQEGFTLYYDENWISCKKEVAVFSLSLQMKYEQRFCTATITVLDLAAKSSIYNLDAGKYTEEEGRS